MVYTEHNGDCPLDYTAPVAPLSFKPEVIQGETANARRRNAKRANRKAAKKARQQAQKHIQEYV